MPTNIDDAATGVKHDPSLALPPDEKHHLGSEAHTTELPAVVDGRAVLTSDLLSDELPTEEELVTLRRVASAIPFKAYTVAFIELCERFSYYGTTVVFTNFIQQKLPAGSTTGSNPDPQGHAGALAMGQRASTGIGTFNQFWVYFTPLIGAYIADTYLGRFNAICVSLAIAIVGHVLLTASAAPSILTTNTQGSLACFLIGLIIMGVGTGGFKPNISPLVAEQIPLDHMKIEVRKGERVIVDPSVTRTRVYHYFYLFINIGALIGQIGMSYAEKYVGFYLSYLLPTLLLCCCPLVMYLCRNVYARTPPQGSVLGKAVKLFLLGNKGKWSINPVRTYKNLHDGTFWENVKPSRFEASARPTWMTFDDEWVDEVGRGFAACSVFLWFPLYWLTYNQLNNNLTSQAAVMTLNGLPNDVLSNLDPFALIILIPIMDSFVYPGFRKIGFNFTPIKRITLGFFLGAMAMIWAAVIQAYIYQQSECGYNASADDCKPVGINVWAQTGSYILIAISEIFASITALEYAFSKAPKNMRSLVMSFFLFMSAVSAALGEAFVYLSADPLLVWNYGVMGVLSAIGGVCFWFMYRQLDKDEDRLNQLPTGHLGTVNEVEQLEAHRRASVTTSSLDKSKEVGV